MAPLASLVIATRNRARFLARTLASLHQQRERGFEVVIADDGSEDDTRDIALAAHGALEIRYLRRAPVGIAAARNAAIRAARGRVLILCDDDRIADPAFVADHVAAHSDGVLRVAAGRQRGLFAQWSIDAAYRPRDVASLLARHPEHAGQLGDEPVELVSPGRVRDDLAGVLAGYDLDEPWWEGHARLVLQRWGAELQGYAFPWSLGVGGNCSVPRALAEQIGLHDERFVGWGLEDTDFHYRLHRAGARTVILDGGLNYHQVHRRGAERAWEWTRNARYLLDKHDTLEIALFINVCRHQLELHDANAIMQDHLALGDRAQHLVREIIRQTRENLRAVLG